MRHETFFSCVQAACYILCFYGIEMANIQKKSKSMQKKWQTVLTCTLNPLRFCLQSVRVEFIRLAQQSNMLDASCWESLPVDILPSNRGDDASRRKSNVNMGSGTNPLDSFFPYDPCLLRMLYQSIENNYRSWKGVPGLDDVIDVDVEVDVTCPIDSTSSISAEYLHEQKHQDDVVIGDGLEEITRSRESSICSDSSSECSQSMCSSATPFGGSNESGMRSSTHSQSQSVNVSMSISMTESVGMGLLEEREVEKRERGEKGSQRYLDSRAQSMVSDCSLEDDPNNLTIVRGVHTYSHSHSQPQSQSQSQIYTSSSSNSNNTLISYAQFGAMVGRTDSTLGLANIGGIGAMIDNGVRNKENRDTLGINENENDSNNDGNLSTRLSVNNITQLADKSGWAKPDRRPRQYSVGSTGSW